MSIHKQDHPHPPNPWPAWKRGLLYALYALAAAGAIELVDLKVHLPSEAGVAGLAATQR